MNTNRRIDRRGKERRGESDDARRRKESFWGKSDLK